MWRLLRTDLLSLRLSFRARAGLHYAKLIWTPTLSVFEQMIPVQAAVVWSGRIHKSIVVRTECASFLWKAIFPAARFSPTAVSTTLSGKVLTQMPFSMLPAGGGTERATSSDSAPSGRH